MIDELMRDFYGDMENLIAGYFLLWQEGNEIESGDVDPLLALIMENRMQELTDAIRAAMEYQLTSKVEE